MVYIWREAQIFNAIHNSLFPPKLIVRMNVKGLYLLYASQAGFPELVKYFVYCYFDIVDNY